MKPLSSTLLLAAFLIVGCSAGSGELSPPANGEPPSNEDPPSNDDSPNDEDPPGDNEPSTIEDGSLAQLQRDIFDSACSQCHFGSAAPEGLRLDSEQNSFDGLVEVPSSQQPDVLLVAPGNPDESYLVRKIEGDGSITGAQMPQFGTPLNSERMAQVRDWIANGAPREGTGDAPTSLSMAPTHMSDDHLTVQMRFSRPIDADNLNDALELYLQDDNHRWLLWSNAYDLHLEHNQSLTITLSTPDTPSTGVELIVNGPAHSLMDHNQRPIDANKDGQEGGSARYEYSFK